MTDVRAYAAELDAALPDILGAIARVVNIDSGSYHAAGVNATIDVFAAMLLDLGFAVERAPLPDRGDRMTARMTLGNGPRLLVLGHADTVWPAGTVAEWPFARDRDRITGPGVGDMKSAVVTAIFTLGMLLRRGLPGLGSIVFLVVPDEELGSPLSRAWIEEEARNADLCLTLEPARPDGGIVVGRGAVGAAYLRATGVTAHAGVARADGASAIAALAPLVAPIEALTDMEKGDQATVGIFRGGAARQVVPGEAEMHVDLRAPDDASAAAMFAAIERIVAGPPPDPRVTVALSGGFARPAFPTHPGTRALYALAKEFCTTLGAPAPSVVARGGSDGSFAAALGVPTLDGLGPVCHHSCSRREWVEVHSIAERGAVLAGLIAAAASGRIGLEA
ncbi:MAG: M20/M25/M40 family metallo-hydrolase [Alphaproteobacteria bacterium]|nr:M20/M25/M40 family metallo-hydrolase [Alphaproteobacteria bacterium]